jgi:hypothetical protein
MTPPAPRAIVLMAASKPLTPNASMQRLGSTKRSHLHGQFIAVFDAFTNDHSLY